MAKEIDETDIEFHDSENHQGGDDDALTYARIILNQISRISIAAGKEQSETGDSFPRTVMSLASLLKNYIVKYPDIEVELKKVEVDINAIKNNYVEQSNKWKRIYSGKVPFNQMQYEMNEFRVRRNEELTEQYLELFNVLIKICVKENWFGGIVVIGRG